MGTQLTIDKVGWVYIGIAIAWSTVMASAMAFLWYHRRLPQLRMRRLPLMFVAIVMLHIYWTLCMIGYVIGPVAPCAAEYWIMSILVPSGIAMFQIANTQFLYVASQQKRFTSVTNLDDLVHGRKISMLDGHVGSFWQRTMKRLKNVNQITKMVIFVGIGMTLQVVLTILIFLLSRKFHPEFGVLPANLFGTKTEQRMQCSRGWEWWLSIAWQFVWAWLYAPYILWKSRRVKDTHGWRTQTILCCIAGLPCSPLWLCGLYLPQFAPVNAVFIPPNWFSVSIFLIESFTIFIPCYQVYRHHSLRTETLITIAEWEAKNRALSSISISIGTGSTQVEPRTELPHITGDDPEKGTRFRSVDQSTISSRKGQMYTMLALEHALTWNSGPLQKFAALKDFSGENVSFLTHLASWRSHWPGHTRGRRESIGLHRNDRVTLNDTQLRDQFNSALNLYAAFISHEYAEFPINLSSRAIRQLDAIFAGPARIIFGDSSSQTTYDSATPFERDQNKSTVIIEMGSLRRKSSENANGLNLNDVWYWGEISQNFSIDCFNAAEAEIKYLVLTNTWPKFVNAGFAEQIQHSEGRTLVKRISQHFYRDAGTRRMVTRTASRGFSNSNEPNSRSG